MAAIPWGSPSMEKTQRKSQSVSSPHRFPTPGHVDAPAPPFPWVHVRVLLHFPPPSAFQLFFAVLQGQWEGGKRGKGFCLPHHAAARYRCAPPPLPQPRHVPELSSAESCLEQKDCRGDAPAPGSVFTDSQNSLRDEL